MPRWLPCASPARPPVVVPMARRTACRRNAPADLASLDGFPIAALTAPFQFHDHGRVRLQQHFYRAFLEWWRRLPACEVGQRVPPAPVGNPDAACLSTTTPPRAPDFGPFPPISALCSRQFLTELLHVGCINPRVSVSNRLHNTLILRYLHSIRAYSCTAQVAPVPSPGGPRQFHGSGCLRQKRHGATLPAAVQDAHGRLTRISALPS
jgi:hypothetical protein